MRYDCDLFGLNGFVEFWVDYGGVVEIFVLFWKMVYW